MNHALMEIDLLPHRESTSVKNEWGNVARQVRDHGGVAITNRHEVTMVFLSANAYRELLAKAQQAEARNVSALDQLTTSFNARLAVLQTPDARKKADAFLANKGLVHQPVIAGETC